MPHDIDVQIASEDPRVPRVGQIKAWVEAALAGRCEAATLTVRVVDAAEGACLNKRWRGQDGSTNVLSFPVEGIGDIAPGLLGDVVVCAPLIAAEAAAQDKPAEAHWAHIVVHGVLHLLGFDHEHARDGREMEGLERTILAHLGYADPYGSETCI